MESFIEVVIFFSRSILPWVVLGSALDYAIGKVLKPEQIRKWFHRGGPWKIFAIQYLGMASPFTTMSFLPIAGRFVRKGANPGLMFGFLAAERSYGIQSFFIITALFGFMMAFLHFIIISMSLFSAMYFTRNDSVSFKKPQAGPDPHHKTVFLMRQVRLYAYVMLGIIIAAAVQVFLPQSVIEFFAGNTALSVLGAVVLSLLLYLGTIFGNYPVARTFLEAGMAPVGALLFLVLSPLANLAVIVLFLSVTHAKNVLKFVLLYSVTGMVLTGLAWWIFL
jgi:uncharacterized membrane protein YraQ (UPF0718 family)